jgi:Kef-type K+ transport system membrane component KefB
MTESMSGFPLIVLVTGSVIVLTMLLKAGLERTVFPPIVGFLIIGMGLKTLDINVGLLSHEGEEVLHFMAKIGLVALLFRVGLESNLGSLISQLRRASFVWLFDVTLSALCGYAAARYLLGADFVPSLIVAAAMTATSVGISVTIWQEQGALQSANGSLLVDVAELDDVSAIILMALLFSVLPMIHGHSEGGLGMALATTSGVFALKLVLFAGGCFLFSQYGEKPLTDYLRRLESPADFMLMVVGIGVIIASVAAFLGFSLAIGAFFAGLVFSRDPAVLRDEVKFIPIYEFFMPFFFIGIGLQIDPSSFSSALGFGAVLFLAAIIGKMIGDAGAVYALKDARSAALIGTSMVPRAEIAMVIMQQGLRAGEWAVPAHMYGAMVVVSALTCLAAPLVVQSLLTRWPQEEAGGPGHDHQSA